MENLNIQRNFEKLYVLQDQILNIVKKQKIQNLYLTGGTALHRFYYTQYRYSQDLDFFSNNHQEDFDVFLSLLSKNGIKYTLESNNNDFKRLLVANELKIDLVNDTTPYLGNMNFIDGINVDNKENIFSNKLSAIISRSEFRDVYDIYVLLKNNKFNKSEIIESFRQKTSDDIDLVYSMLESFPIQNITLKHIDFINQAMCYEFKNEYKEIINDFIFENKV